MILQENMYTVAPEVMLLYTSEVFYKDLKGNLHLAFGPSIDHTRVQYHMFLFARRGKRGPKQEVQIKEACKDPD